MAAEFFQMLRAAVKSVDHMKAADAARRAFAVAAIETDDDGRTVKLFDDARRDDAEHAGMPALARQYQRMAAGRHPSPRLRLRQGML